MKIYRIFLKKDKNGKIEDLILIKEGFSIFTFIFQGFYLLSKQLWLEATILFGIIIFSNILKYYFKILFISIPLQLGVLLYYSFEFNDLFTKRLIKDGYEYLGYSSGKDEKEAKLKFLDTFTKSYDNKKEDKLETKVF